MTEITERVQAVQERIAQRREANRAVTRFGRSAQAKRPALVRRGPMPDASGAAEAAWRRYGGGDSSRFDRGPAL